MELGAGRQRAAESGQHGLFASEDQAAPATPEDLPEVPEWSEAERLAGEKEVLGFYVTGHPLEKYRAQMAAITRYDSSSLQEIDHDAPVTLAGILTTLNRRTSKKGDLWASGVLEDLRGTAELLVFPKALQQLQGVLQPEAALVIKGRVRHEENAPPRVVVSEARPLDAAVNGGKGGPAAGGRGPELWIRLSLENANQAAGLADQLGALLAAYPGSNPVVFELTRAGDFRVRMRARQPAAVRAEGELMERLKQLCGENAVSLSA
jgi:DNA polymerase-3 subunit alpha